ncbi:MAG: hypothetical protein N2320_00625 [Candidatus Bipolaricaulota bacterium]|nr:hypothetical protein [Candidatus Bipolaricaulota bacterium]
MGEVRKRKTWREFLRELREIYLRGDPRGLAAAWQAGRRTPGARLLVWSVERIYPVGQTLEVAAELEARMAREGLGAASRWLLATFFPGWRAEIPPETAEALASSPVLIYGNHPSFLTPFLVAATVPREDLKMVSDSILDRLLPSFQRHALPVSIPPAGGWGELRAGGLPRVIVTALAAQLWRCPPDQDEVREANRRSLAGAAEHVRSGGAVLITPGGWSPRDRLWFSGIGQIALDVHQGLGGQPWFLVPFREERSSNDRVRAVLSSGPVARVKRGLVYRKPVTIRYGTPLLLSSLGRLPNNPSAATRLLEDRYRRDFGL